MGKLKLVPGASIIGWLGAPSQDFRFADCKVTLTPKSAGDSRTQKEAIQRSRLVFTAQPNERGFFELTEMPPGQYALLIEHPAYATTRKAPVQVYPRAETEIRNLELLPPAELTVNVFPPVSTTGGPWRVLLMKESDTPGHLDSEQEGQTQSGLWIAKELDPGHYIVSIEDSRGAKWERREVTLHPGQTEARIDVLMEAVYVKGQVFHGEEPIQATLFFGGFFGSTRVTARSDEDGKYSATLPRRASWKLDIDAPSLKLRRELPDVDFDLKPKSDITELDIELPDLRLRGLVVDQDGHRHAGAFVDARLKRDGPSYSSSTVSEKDGSFILHALDPGTWQLRAQIKDQHLRRSHGSSGRYQDSANQVTK